MIIETVEENNMLKLLNALNKYNVANKFSSEHPSVVFAKKLYTFLEESSADLS